MQGAASEVSYTYPYREGFVKADVGKMSIDALTDALGYTPLPPAERWGRSPADGCGQHGVATMDVMLNEWDVMDLEG